jgi:hypothetical protein
MSFGVRGGLARLVLFGQPPWVDWYCMTLLAISRASSEAYQASSCLRTLLLHRLLGLVGVKGSFRKFSIIAEM